MGKKERYNKGREHTDTQHRIPPRRRLRGMRACVRACSIQRRQKRRLFSRNNINKITNRWINESVRLQLQSIRYN